jgi:hypothetical protein
MLVSLPTGRQGSPKLDAGGSRFKFQKTNIDTSFDNDKHPFLYLLWNRFLDLIGRFPLGFIVSSN